MYRLLLPLLLLFSTPAFAVSTVNKENTTVTLLAAQNAVRPGDTVAVGVFLQARPGWHTYWENPGDAGIPTEFTWTLPQGVSAGGIQWPLPEMIREDTLAVFGYTGNVFLPVTITVPADYSGTTLPIQLAATWLVCDKICVPEDAELTLDIPIGEPTPSDASELFAEAEKTLPAKIDSALPYKVTEKTFEITLPASIPQDGKINFMPREQNHVLYAEPQTVNGGVLTVSRNVNEAAPEALSGYLVAGDKAFDIRAENAVAAPAAAGAAAETSAGRFLVLVLFAILGGLILNLMPCVLPILSLKAIAIAKKSGHDRHVIVKQALAYTLGVVVSFTAIASLLIGLQMAGESIGWGFQMQSPPFVGFLVILLSLVGMNLAGMFELPVLFGNSLSDTPKHGLRGSFLTGVLATAVATPCTAPFMATAVGATLTLPPALALIVFVSIGLGLALPFLLIAIFPKLVAYLPRPGAWMITFKQLMAFPMFASVIWLLWVLTRQTGAQGLLVVLVTMLALSFIIWLKGRCKDPSRLCRYAVLLLLLAVLVNGLAALSMVQAPKAGGNEEAFSQRVLDELRASGTPVFVDATAAWCLTCQVNAQTSILTANTQAAFAATGTKLLVADWTNRDPEITAFLKKFGYNGVPLYVYFPASGEPVVLPQILSESLVISTLKGQTP